MQLSSFPYDFHMHSNYSDGSLSPEDLVTLVHDRGIQHFALTDHDTVAGVVRAQNEATKCAITMTTGVEISADWNGKVIHVLGLNVDIYNTALGRLLSHIQETRYNRLEAMLNKLERGGISLSHNTFPKQEGVSYGRMHIAMALVDAGVVGKVGSGFKQYLAKGKRAYVATTWPSLEEVVATILQAGGVPVIAHPRRYKISFKRLTSLVSDFHSLGGMGIELATASQGDDDRRLIYSLVKQFDLLMSQGSDFHHPGGYIQPGMISGLPEGRYVWDQFRAR